MNRYSVTIYWSDVDEAWLAFSPDIPGCRVHGDSREEVLRIFESALHDHLESMKEDGYPMPPVSTGDPYHSPKRGKASGGRTFHVRYVAGSGVGVAKLRKSARHLSKAPGQFESSLAVRAPKRK
ncbi:hypothetical protein DB346_17300 [Verrucomicrobia bacterium LW23]|nr:hypothetical protein DB346_17300 [Verrucomicrobia bacterium LW23]